MTKQSILAVVAGAAALCTLPVSASAKVAEIVTWAVPPAGTSGYILASAFSKTLRDKTPMTKIVLQTFGGSAGWPARMNTGEVNFSSHCGFKQIEESYMGEGPFKSIGRQKNIRIMATGHGLPFVFVVIPDEVKTMKDMKGRRAFVLMTHRDQATAMRVWAKMSGLQLGKDIKVIAIRSPSEAFQGMRTGRGDALFYGMIPPLAAIKQAKGLHAVSMPDAVIKAVQKEEPIWDRITIPAGRPPLREDKPIETLQIKCGTAAGAKTSPETVYAATKAIFENLSDWNGVHPLAKQWNIKTATKTMSAPYHEGAIRYYKEKGVWSEQNEKDNKAWLAK